ncbi:MAG: hypothetical protein HY720_13540, partial [Planctomycetes bacterium]|nr:hypothetical protein [Planctomycetota bacterium]
SLATATTSRAVLGPTPYRDRLLARWTARSLDADAGGGPLDAVVDSAGPTVASVLGEGPLGCLLADGVYSEIDSTLAYVAPGNVGPLQGTLAFWVKPSWDTSGPDRSNRSHHLLSMSRQDDVGTQSFQLAQVGSWSGGWSDLTGFHFERSTLENSLAERLVYSSWTPPGHRWTHVVLAWDFTEQRADRAIAVYVDGVELPGAIREFTGSYDLLPEELLRAPITRGNLLRLGERLGFDFGLPAASAEATFDELVSLPVRMDADWAAAAYAQGRFYSAGKANFVSAALTVPPGSELLWASWTVREPLEGAPPVTLTVAQDGLPIASTSDPAGFSIGRAVTGEIRYSLIFLDAAAPRSLYASAAVDDVTLAFATRPRILSWEES